MTHNHARFIVFEGLDGAGTTTQSSLLHGSFTQRSTPSFLTHEPTPEPVGAFIRRVLTGQERGRDGAPYHPGERTLGLLFAADRLAHSRVIEGRLQRGEHVVCDRYLLSSIAYQTLDSAISPQWVVDVNRGCTVPHLTLFLAVPVDICLARIGARHADSSIYETRAHLETIADNYERLLPMYEASFGRVVRIDGSGEIEDVFAKVSEAVATLR